MSEKDIQKLFKSNIDTQIPNVLSKIDLESIEILDAPKPRFAWRFNRIYQTGLIALTSLVFLFVLFSLRSPKNETTTPMVLTSEKTYSFSAISSSVLLETVEVQLALDDPMVLLNSMNQGTRIKNRISLLNPYFNMIELFISNQDLTFSDPIPSTMAGYTYQITYEIQNLNQESETYTFHYNIIVLDGLETTEGFLNLGSQSYFLEGSKQIENGKTIIRTITYQNELEKSLNFIEFVSIESEDEQHFDYTVYQKGEAIEQTEVQLERINRLMSISLNYTNLISDIDVELKANRIEGEIGSRIRIQYDYQGPFIEEKGTIILTLVYDEDSGKLAYRFVITNSKGQKDDIRGVRGNHSNRK